MLPAPSKSSSSPSWQQITKASQAHRDATLSALDPPLPVLPADLPLDVTRLPRDVLTAEEVRITELMPEEVVAQLASRELSAVQVTKAFLRRAGLAQMLVG